MKNLKTVFSFELKEMVVKKSYIITLAILCVIAFLAVSLPTIFNFFNKDGFPSDLSDFADSDAPFSEPLDASKIGFVVLDPNYEIEKMGLMLQEPNLKLYDSEADLKTAVIDHEVEKGFVIKSMNEYKYIVNDRSMYDMTQGQLESLMRQIAFENNLIEKGINPSDVNQAMMIQITSSVDQLGKDSASGFAFAYIFMFVLYMLVLLFGQTVSVSVAREKDNRTMELLITSTNPKVLIIGKVFAAGLAGVIQIGAIILTVIIGFLLNRASYPTFILEMLSVSLSIPTLIVYLLFSVLGYILYLFIFAALGSLVSKVEDVNSAVTPIMLIFIAAFMIASVGLNAPDLKLVVISSYIPFVSLFTMPIRFMLTSVSFFEVLVSAALLVVTAIAIAYLSIYIYRLGSLNYGNKMKIKEIIKSFKKRNYEKLD